MTSLLRNCMFQGKCYFRDRSQVFWTMLFPILLAVFFNLAFSDISSSSIGEINIGASKGNPIHYMLSNNEVFRLLEIEEDEYVKMLENETIHVYVDENLDLYLSQSGIRQSIVKEVVEEIKQTLVLGSPIGGSELEVDYIKKERQESDPYIVMFYALIAMVTSYGLFIGIEVVSKIQANLSNVGIRLNATPLKKETFLIAGTLVALCSNLISNGVLIIFLQYILKKDLLTNIGHSLILIFFGNLFGVSLGIFIGASNKKDSGVKVSIGTATSLFLSFLSGLMGPWMKNTIDTKASIIGRINPISIITNNLYRINLLQSTKKLGEGIIILSIYTLILLFASYMFIRRKSYDSI
ncbi:MAG: ABC transporter permease [Clostridiales bacterium]|nr:ABC transporter permease [Clostridiales bacterium]